MLRLEKVATPETAAREVTPDSVPPLGLAPIATVTIPVKPVAVLPSASSAVTLTAGEINAPAAVVGGGTVNTRLAAGPPVMLNAPLELLTPPDVASSRYPVPTLLMLKSLNDAMPATAARVAVPDSVPPPGLTVIDIVMFPVKLVTVLP